MNENNEKNTPSNHFQSRREACPFSWNELTEQQKKAVEFTAPFLLDALKRIKQSEAVKTASMDFDRRRQLIFIDGDRGMGKTSVLLSLRNIIENDTDDVSIEAPREVRRLREERRKFIWLETLDMEPLPPTSNLLAAILVRISAQLESPSSRRKPYKADHKQSDARLALAFDDLDATEELASELQQLENNAVRAWEGTQRQRATYSDPTAYAAEVLASERAGIDLNPRIGSVLNDLAETVFADLEPGPLFIMPVDDFDLAPTRCLELLRIIRVVSTPRLFFLVAGNTRISETVLRLQSTGELVSLLGSVPGIQEPEEIQAFALEIAANNLRKLIPPHQRARLEMLSVSEARNFRTSPDSDTLEHKLGGVFFTRNNAPDRLNQLSLRSFLFPEESQYSGSGWLMGTPRQVIDRMAMVGDLAGEYRGDKEDWGRRLLVPIVEDLIREIQEYGHVRRDQRDAILRFLDVRNSLVFNFREIFSLTTETGRIQKFEGEWFKGRCEFPRSYRWLFGNRRQGEADNSSPLAPRLASSLTFLHDLSISIWGGYVFPSSIIYESSGIMEPVTLDWTGREEQAIRWGMPEWWTLREHERFARCWESHVKQSEKVDDHIRGWLAAQLEILMEEPHDDSKKGRSTNRLLEILKKLGNEIPSRRARMYLRDSALVEIVLLLAPESGCSDLLAGEFTGRIDHLSRWVSPELLETIRERRARSFVTVWRRERELLVDVKTVRLLSAISPGFAIEIAREHLKQILPRPDSQELSEIARNLISEIRTQPTESNFVRNLQSLRKLEGSPFTENLKRAIDVVIEASAKRYVGHPINKLLDENLVPRREEIERAEPRQSRRR